MTLPPWDPDQYDREVRAERHRQRAERAKSGRSQTGQKGLLTAEQLKRRKAMDRAMKRRASKMGEG